MSVRRLALIAAAAMVALLAIIATPARGADDDDNPHAKMRKDQSVCIDCHTKLVKPGEHAPDYFLTEPPSELCLGCHDEHEHAGVAEHAGKDVKAPWLGDENGKIACFTCHDPHPEGVLAGRRVYRDDALPLRTGAESATASTEETTFGALLRFSVTGGEGCLPCHDVRGDGKTWRERTTWHEFRPVLPR